VKVKLFIATVDVLYAKLISDNISEHHAGKIEVSTCSTPEGLNDAISKQKNDVALIDAVLIEYADISRVKLPLLLWSETDTDKALPDGPEKINKHQRISSIVASILEQFAKVSGNSYSADSKQARITAVWSPAGGVGKTSVSLAYALSCAAEDKEVFYLSLENFLSTSCYLSGNGKSISTAFEMLEKHDGNLKMLIQGISCKDKGITFLCAPENYDDMCILSCENVRELVTTCAELSDELVIDLSSACDPRVREVFELTDNVLLVTDPSPVTCTKLTQFITQNNVFENIKEKVTLVANKGAIIHEAVTNSMISLPLIQSNDTNEVCRALSKTASINCSSNISQVQTTFPV